MSYTFKTHGKIYLFKVKLLLVVITKTKNDFSLKLIKTFTYFLYYFVNICLKNHREYNKKQYLKLCTFCVIRFYKHIQQTEYLNIIKITSLILVNILYTYMIHFEDCFSFILS